MITPLPSNPTWKSIRPFLTEKEFGKMGLVCRHFVVLSPIHKMERSLHQALCCQRIAEQALQVLAQANRSLLNAWENSGNSVLFIKLAINAPMPSRPDPNSVFSSPFSKDTATEDEICLYFSPVEPYVWNQKPIFSSHDPKQQVFQQAMHYQSMVCGWLELAGQAQNTALHLQEWANQPQSMLPRELLSHTEKALGPVFGLPYEDTCKLLTKEETNAIVYALQSGVRTLSFIQSPETNRSLALDFAPNNAQDSPESPSDSEASSDEEEIPLPFRQCQEEMRVKRKLRFRWRERDFTTTESYRESPLAECSYPKRRTALPPPLGEAVALLILQEAEDSDTF